MGPLANPRRVTAMEGFIQDAVQKGAEIQTGGKRIGNKGNFFEPTVLTNVNTGHARDERGAVRPARADRAVRRFRRGGGGSEPAAVRPRLVRLHAARPRRATAIAHAIEAGMLSINSHGLALPEVPFGGVKDSGYGSEGGAEAIEAYLNTKFVSQVGT